MLYQQAIPQANVMTKAITAMIDIESTLEASVERKALLGMMADVRGSLGLSLANIRGYLLSGEYQYKIAYNTLWQKNTLRFQHLNDSKFLLNEKQLDAFERFKSARTSFDSLPSKMKDIRSKNNWNIANYLLGTKATPLGFEIKKSLKAMEENQSILLNSDSNAMKSLSNASIDMAWILLLVGIAFGVIVSIIITRSIVLLIHALEKIILNINKNKDLTLRAPENGDDEIQMIASALNQTFSGLQTSIQNITDANNTIPLSLDSSSDTAGQTSQAKTHFSPNLRGTIHTTRASLDVQKSSIK